MKYSYPNFQPVPAQHEAIIHPPGPLLIIAGAGTGKTATILHRIRYHVLEGSIDPKRLLILTFTEKATAELKRKMEILDVPGHENISISTFHAFCFRVVQDYGLSGTQPYKHLDDFSIAYLLLKRYDELTFLQSEYFRSQPRPSVFSHFIPFFSRLRDELIAPDDIEQLRLSHPISEENILQEIPGLKSGMSSREAFLQFEDLIKVYQQYQNWKAELHLLDYGDMVLQSWQLIQTPAVLNDLRKRFQDIFIDEYQDNNYALNKIINHIMSHDPRLTVVGDEDQCIYSFRGANYYNIHDFKNRYGNDPRYRMVTLETNFRSTQPILDLANHSISHDPDRSPKKLTASHPGESDPLPVWIQGSKREQLSEMVSTIKAFIAKGFPYDDIAVLCRTSGQLDEVIQELKAHSLPVHAFRDRLNGIPEIRLLTAWIFALTDNPRYRMAFQHLYKTYCPDEFIKPVAFDELLHFDRSGSSPAVAALIGALQNILIKIHQKAGPDEIVWNILKESKLLAEAKVHYRYRDRLMLRNMGTILSLAENFTATHTDATFEDWQLFYDLLINQDNAMADKPFFRLRSGIQVMTVHMAKGLQFPVVIIPFLRSNSFPLNYRGAPGVSSLPDSWFRWSPVSGLDPKIHHVNEERRIFYVAVTRAQRHLYLFGPEKSTSLFLKEIMSAKTPLLTTDKAVHHEDKPMLKTVTQKVLQELHQEIEANQQTNILALTAALNDLVTKGTIKPDNPYAYFNYSESTGNATEPETTLRLSASAVEEYIQCPYKYRLSQIDRVPQRKSSAQMMFGSIIHKVLQFFHEAKHPSEELLYELLDQYWQTDVFEYKIRETEFYRQAREMLSNYWQFLPRMNSTFQAAECNFEFDIPEWSIQIKGKIDRIDRQGDGLLVIDYKTGKQPERDGNKKSLQLALYTEALQRDAVKEVRGKPGAAQLLYLKDLDHLHPPHSFTAEEIDEHLQKVKNAADGIRANSFPVKPAKWTCKYCDYKEFLCPAWEND